MKGFYQMGKSNQLLCKLNIALGESIKIIMYEFFVLIIIYLIIVEKKE